MDFNKYKDSYSDVINSSLKFTGKDHDFFTSIKANFLKDIIKNEFLNQQPHVLDVGCGHGLIHKYLKNLNLKLTGIEIAEEVLDLAKEDNPGVAYHSYDGRTLPFEINSFDLVFTICVMHHVPPAQWISFLSEIKRVLKPGGMIVIFEHNPYNLMTRYIVANNELDNDAVLLSNKKLKKMLRETGFLKEETHHILFTPFKHNIFRRLEKLLSWCPLGAQYYALAFK